MHIVVAGGGMAGLSAALALGRAGHKITLIERDGFEVSDDPLASFKWERRGIAHFLQPHAFLPRGRRELISLFPDVYRELLNAGATDYGVYDKIRGQRNTEDDDLVYLSVRRPLIEWALRKALSRESGVNVLPRTRITEQILEESSVPRVRGVITDGGHRIEAEMVIDAQGRTSLLTTQLRGKGCFLRTETSKTHIVYYSRYFKMREGNKFPRGPWLTTPRGDLGYAGFSSFTGDNHTFALVLAVGSWDRELRILQHERAWDAVARKIPVLASLVDSEFAVPITPVLAMGELQNTLRHFGDSDSFVHGLVPIGDALCHTDPTFALGLSFALVQAHALTSAVTAHEKERPEVLHAFWRSVYPELKERFDMAVATDDARTQMWRGEKLDVFHANGCYPLFTMVAASIAALSDDEVFRRTIRRIGFLDRLAAFDDDSGLHRKVEQIVAEHLSKSPRSIALERDELLQVAQASCAM